MENPIIKAQERFNNRPTYRIPVQNACECGRFEAIAMYKGRQRLCEDCLEGIVEVRML